MKYLAIIAALCLAVVSTVPAQQSQIGGLRAGNTLWVDAVNGSDDSGTRGNAGKPFLTIGQAKTNAVAGDCINVLSGNYTNNNLLKVGVNYFFYPGARVWWTDSGSGNGYGFFDDRPTGATTNTIAGFGDFIYSSPLNANVMGAFVVTNAISVMSVRARSIGFADQLGASAVSGCIAVRNCRFFDAIVDELYDQDFGAGDSYSAGVYWEAGETHVTAGRIRMDDGYCVWAKEIATGTTNGLWVTANQMEQYTVVGGTGAIEVDALTDPFRVWIDTKEVNARSGIAYRQAGGGRVYVRAEKINGGVSLLGGNLWLDSQKISSGTGVQGLTVSGGFLWGNVTHLEDTGGGLGILLTGGTNFLRGGIAIYTNAPAVKWGGGITTLEGMTLVTITNTAAIGRATNASVMAYGTNSSTAMLTLRNCTLYSGGTNSIFTTNTSVIVQVENGLTTTNAAHPNVIFTNASSYGGGYALVFPVTVSINPADATTYYFGGDTTGGATINYTNANIEIPKSGVIRRWSLKTKVGGTAGSSETVSHFVRVNDLTDYAQIDQVYTLVTTNNFAIMNVPVVAGDTIAVKVVAPTWVTNPTTVRWFATVWIE